MVATNIKPLRDGVLVQRLEEKGVTAGGILIPDSSKEKPSSGVVVAVGPGARDGDKITPLELKVGDKVLFSKWNGTKVDDSDDSLLIMKESDILAIIS